MLAGETDADAWLVELASSPFTTVNDPRRSTVPSVAAAAAVMQGERAVSPRCVLRLFDHNMAITKQRTWKWGASTM
jgi:hypothetical protein